MKNETASFPTDSGGAGMSEPVFRKGIVCSKDWVFLRKEPSAMSETIVGLIDGMEVDIVGDVGGFYRIRVSRDSLTVEGYVPSCFVRFKKPNVKEA